MEYDDDHVHDDVDAQFLHDAVRGLNTFPPSPSPSSPSPSPSPSTSLISNSSNRVAVGKFLMVYYVVVVGGLMLPVVFNRFVR